MTTDDVAKLLRKGRRHADVSVRDAAKAHGLTMTRLRTLESGHGLAPVATVLSMLETYGLRVIVTPRKTPETPR